MYSSDLPAYHLHAELHPQAEASVSLPSVHDDSATTLVTGTTLTACQTDKNLVDWVHALKKNKTEAINVVHSSELQVTFGFPLRELEGKRT